MKYSIEHDNNEEFCVIHVSGTHRRPNDSKTLHRVASDIRVETGCSSILYDMRSATIIGSTMDIFEVGVALIERDFKRDFSIAVVYSGDMEDHTFMESVILNRGYNLRVFDDIEKATIWLTRKTSPCTVTRKKRQ